MEVASNLALSVCGSGGSDAAALIVVVVVIVLWLLAVGAVIRAAEDGTERALLLGLVLASLLIGAGIFFLPEGVDGDGDYLSRFFLALLIPGAIGVGVALLTRAVHVGRALFISVCGALFLTGGIFLLLFASLLLGTGCLD
jgi:hypothetical protein